MTKFETLAIRKQEEAYSLKFAEKQFGYSCQMCATRNLRHGHCEHCPVAMAYQEAVQAIMSGERKKPNNECKRSNPGYTKYVDRMGHITLVVNININ